MPEQDLVIDFVRVEDIRFAFTLYSEGILDRELVVPSRVLYVLIDHLIVSRLLVQ